MNYHELETSIGERIRFYRETKNISQMELARRSDISNTSISNFEKGRQTPSLVTLAKLSQALEISLDDLFFGDISERFITAAEDEAAAIVNSICKLWDTGVLTIWQGEKFDNDIEDYFPDESHLKLQRFQSEIIRLMKGLRDFEQHKESYQDSQGFLKALKESVTTEIRKKIVSEKEK